MRGGQAVTRVQRDTLAYLLIVIFCIVMLVWAIPTYSPPYPGYGASPALVPNVSVSVMLAMALLALIRNVLATYGNKPLPIEESTFPDEREASGFTQIGRINLIHLGAFVIPSALLIVGINYIGFLPAAFIFMLIIQYVIGSRRLVQPVVVAVVSVVVMYVTMRYGFGVPVPGPQLF